MKIVLNNNDPKSDIIYAALREAFLFDRHCVVNFSGVEIKLDMESLTTSHNDNELTVEFGDFRPLSVVEIVDLEQQKAIMESAEYLEGLRSALGDRTPSPYVGVDYEPSKSSRWATGFDEGEELTSRHLTKAEVEHKVTHQPPITAGNKMSENLRKTYDSIIDKQQSQITKQVWIKTGECTGRWVDESE